ncbi:MYB DNA binding protein (Tbf1), putative [Talaromyces stipitatus ATCC 10500]|uniref:MYB DNA binding protein (Tbf1), putative n=1 Tax=Talaromyces stipitatus (strain ATCC 10500 / CBS 375.48 / QM 6759 / NRRL 1006) TaxID=441959 RepID=B8LTG8_TALSN|nr:MYB DNA binding protein (Tbf1), putative [Talaromyces stipitatus ATCC 10500]EED23046.1 MYB DNA binding protein (Tbf1), putative [Talaromyces stipitatus ATCC 10500]
MESELSTALPEQGNVPTEKATHDLEDEPGSPHPHKKRRTDPGFGDSPDIKEETDIAHEDPIEEALIAALNPPAIETATEPETQPVESNTENSIETNTENNAEDNANNAEQNAEQDTENSADDDAETKAENNAENNTSESTDAPDPEVAAVFGSIIDRAERLEEQYALDQQPTENSEQSPNKNVTFVKASLSLKIQSLPILDNLSTQILSLLAKSSYQDITSFVSEPESENGQAYATMRSLFDHTKRVYSTKQAFLSPTDLDLTDPTQIDIIRKANLASFVSSIFGSQEISFAELNDHFIDVFVPEGSRLLKVQGALFLELKTQAFIASLNNEERTRTEILFELFPDDLEQRLLSKRTGTRQLAPSEADFVKRARSRRDIIFADINNEEAMKALPDKYHWEDFLRDLSAYISKNFETINSLQSRKLVKGRQSISGESQDGPSGAPLESQFAVATQPAEATTDRNLHGDLVARAARAAQIALQGHGLRKSQQQSQHNQQQQLQQTQQPQQPQQAQTPQHAPQSAQSTPAPQSISQTSQQNVSQGYQHSPTPPGYPQQLTFQHNTIPVQSFQQYTPPQNGSSSMRSTDAVTNYGYMPGVPHYSQSQPTQVLYERARMAATAKSSSNSRRAGLPSQRRPWTTEEENALMAGLDRVKGPHWSQILAMFGPGGTINEALKDRNQVQLKDKARNLKLFFLKSGIEVPYYLKFVTGELKTRAPAQAAKNEAREREKKRGEEDKAHVEGIEGMMALAGAHMSPGQGPDSMSASPAVFQEPERPESHDQSMADQTEEQKLIQSLGQEVPEGLLQVAQHNEAMDTATADMHHVPQ